MDGQGVHRFRCAGEICAAIADQAACPEMSGPALPLSVPLASLLGSITPWAPSLPYTSQPVPETYRDWHSALLAADQRVYSVAVITFKFSVAALLSLVPGRAISRNQVVLGTAPAVNDVAFSV